MATGDEYARPTRFDGPIGPRVVAAATAGSFSGQVKAEAVERPKSIDRSDAVPEE